MREMSVNGYQEDMGIGRCNGIELCFDMGIGLTTKSIGGDQLGSGAHIDVSCVTSEGVVGNEFIGNDFYANEFSDLKQIISGHAKKECHWVADVAKDELQGKIGFAVLGNVDISARIQAWLIVFHCFLFSER